MVIDQYKPGTVLFCVTAIDDEAIAAAKQYCIDNNMGPDDARIAKTKDNCVIVVKK